MLVNRKQQAKICGDYISAGLMMRVQTFSVLFLLAFLFLLQITAAAQEEQSENSQPPEITQTTKFDEFGPLGDCDLTGRLDNFIITLRNYPEAKGYIVFYRGADDEAVSQTDIFAERVLNMYRNHLRYRRFPSERIDFIDGGFRASRVTVLWLAPPGGEIPQPSETVEKPEQPKNKSWLAQRNFLELKDAAIPPPDEEIVEETETQEVQQETVENQDVTAEIETTQTQPETETQVEEVEIEPEEWTSVYFAEALNQEKPAKGRVIYYADETVYDLMKAREIVEKGMRKFAEKSNLNLSRVKIVFGGYRKFPEVEFWIVPRGAKKPKPTPEVKKIREEIESEN